MTREECIDTLKGIKAYYTNDMAIEALEQDPKPLDDGTLCITVDDYSKVQRVLVQDNNKWGGLYYPEQEPTEDCISRQAVMDIMHEMWGDSGELIDALRKLSSVQPKHGEWYKPKTTVRPFGEDTIQCSECGFLTDIDSNYNYCPKCGSRMDSRFERGEI